MIDVSSDDDTFILNISYPVSCHIVQHSHHIHKAARFPKSIPVYIYSLYPSQYF